MRTRFTDDFISAHQGAFDELLALGVLISQNAVEGIESEEEWDKAIRLQKILRARQNSQLTEKEAEALDGCLGLMTESAFVPSISPIITVESGFILFMDGTRMLQVDGAFTKYVD